MSSVFSQFGPKRMFPAIFGNRKTCLFYFYTNLVIIVENDKEDNKIHEGQIIFGYSWWR